MAEQTYLRLTPAIKSILALVKQAGFVVSAWIGQAIKEKAQRDGFYKYATDEEINGEE